MNELPKDLLASMRWPVAFVFRPKVPERYFRRRLLIGAGLYALIRLIVWAVPAIAV